MNTTPRILALACAIAFAASAQVIHAQILEEVIVTAQKRSENLQDVPISVNVMSGETIDGLGLTSFDELATYVPNFMILESSSGLRIAMRGVGSGTNRGFEQSVGLFIDGIYSSRNKQFTSPFFDLERVEVLRGPQGVLFGKNTIAGAVSVITTRPTEEFEGSVSAYWESEYDEWRGTAIVSGALSDTVNARLSVKKSERSDGYLKNTLGDDEGKTIDQELARLVLTWDPTDELSVTAKYEWSDAEENGQIQQLINFGDAGDLFSRFDPEVEDRQNLQNSLGASDRSHYNVNQTDNAFVLLEYALGNLNLVSNTGYSSYDNEIRDEDSDFTPVPLLWFGVNDEFEQWSQELRLESIGNESIEYVAGLYYQDNSFLSRPLFDAQGSTLGLPNTSNERMFDQDSESWSVFGEVTWHVSDSLRLIGGVRYTEEDKQVHKQLTIYEYQTNIPETDPSILFINRALLGTANHDVRDKREEEDWSPAFTVQWDMCDDVMLYAKASRGFKAGGFDASDRIGDAPQYEDEQVTAFEIGSKTTLFDGRAEINASLFHGNYEDLQVQAFDGTLAFLTTNAGEATSQGLELEGRWQIVDRLMLDGSFAYLDAKYDEYEGAACTLEQREEHEQSGAEGSCTQDLSGRPLIASPEWNLNMALSHYFDFSNGWSLDSRLGINYRSEQYVSNGLAESSLVDGYTTVDATFMITGADENWDVSLIARNLTDEREATFISNPPLFSSAEYSFIIPPRTLALQAQYRF
ncbi:MAG: TonB-dependent receptor [Halioglobus sp.]|jgi:outer membrane receptor protein involved in Fe transport|nr:TonB-dependent receptor [Halioglobus sp.]